MTRQIESGDLWDRLALILGDEGDRLPPRPSTGSPYRFPFSHPFKGDWLNETAQARKEVVGAIASLRACAKQIAFGDLVDQERPTSGQLVSVFSASYEYARDDRSVTSIDVQFTATDEFDAIASAIRFWMGRQHAMPTYFNKLFAVKVGKDTIGPINADGSMFNGTGFPFFEWKIDSRGMPLETYALLRMGELVDWEKDMPNIGTRYS